MISRREIVAAAAAAAPAAGLGAIPGAASAATGIGPRIYAVVFDDRFDESVRFARQARRLGHRTRAISGDVTSLWYDDLYHRWKQGPAAIAGLTTVEAAMCLGMLAADAGLRCTFEAEHRCRSPGPEIEHRVRAPADWASVKIMGECGDHWPETLPRLIGDCPAAPAKAEARFVTAAPPRALDDGPTLVSWVFAPIRRP